MKVEIDKDMESVIAFMQSFIERPRLRQVASAISMLAPVIWQDGVPLIRLTSESLISDCDPPTQ